MKQSNYYKTNNAIIAALKRIARIPARNEQKGYFVDEQGRFCVCSGYHAVRLTKHYDGISKSKWDFNGLSKIMQPLENNPKYKLIENVPNIPELREIIKDSKKSDLAKKLHVKLSNGQIVDARYLLDMLVSLQNCNLYGDSNPISPIYCKSDTGDGVLLPIRPTL